MKHVHWITAEPYDWPVLIYVGTWSRFRAYLQRARSVDIGEQTFAGGFHTTIHNAAACDALSVVWLPDDPLQTMRGVRTLSHELLHAAFAILHYVGVSVAYDQQEALAYLHEDLNRKAHIALNSP